MRKVLLLFSLLGIVLTGCRPKNAVEPVHEDFKTLEIINTAKEIKGVLYSMYLPTDMAEVFKRSGSNYNPEIPCSIDDISAYTDLEQVAIMLGIYGVDLTYMKFMEQASEAARYYRAVELLSQKIGLPSDIFKSTSRKLENSFDNKDSLTIVIEDIYTETDRFFKENGNENLAALSLVGGWIEAMYIGTQIFASDTGNMAIAEQILQQKFSLNTIYTILSNHQESLPVKEYLLMLKKLRKIYEEIEIRYQKEGFSVDTTQKKLQSYNAQIKYDESTINDLMMLIPLIRNEVIKPRLDSDLAD